MNNYRLSIMLVIVIMVFLYMTNVIAITPVINYALTLSALIFSISSVFDTFAKENKTEHRIRFCLDTLAICVAIIIPILVNTELIKALMAIISPNVLLLLALFFTMAGQWAMEIKLKEIENHNKK